MQRSMQGTKYKIMIVSSHYKPTRHALATQNTEPLTHLIKENKVCRYFPTFNIPG